MNQKIQYDRAKAEALAACKLSYQQIADVLDIDLKLLRQDAEQMAEFMAVMRKGRAKGEAELRTALFKLAREGDSFAVRELLKVKKSQDTD
ncbi:hypothetical protein [Buttiauxella sp. S19-1]|uniref:hypothetical protein n=1 Tax=Buttiauxella sp. S19-1 TaxID=941430 RepID=UPI001EDB249A|nr:hypothetical protein [Buttiauxella sp. S19-1]